MVLVVAVLLALVESLIIILFHETLLLLSIFILCRVYARVVLERVIIRPIERLLVGVLLLLVDVLEVLRCLALSHLVSKL